MTKFASGFSRIVSVLMIASVLAVAATLAATADDGFLSSIDDMPLPAGVSENEDMMMVFDKPNGRILRTVATGRIDPDAARTFYTDSLPQLGWRAMTASPQDGLLFEREGERLEIDIAPVSGGQTEIRFSIEPIDG